MEHNDGSLSYHLYHELMEFVGTPDMVRKRRMFFKSMNTLASNRLVFVICSGSKAEGLNMPGSDLDIMLAIKGFYVHNDKLSIPRRKNELYLDTEDISAGFAQLKIIHDEVTNLNHTENEIFLENGIIRDRYNILASHEPFGLRPMLKIHGPCLSTFEDSLDILYAIACKSWPHTASKWPSRPRSSKWPSNGLINKILKGPVLLAPIGSKYGSNRDNPNQWRLSFSVAKIMLVHSFNHTQLTCYAMLKLTLKEVINKESVTEKILCSYFLKTILFWIIEESDFLAWQPHKLIECFRLCLKRLSYLVKHAHCPNYFVPENNMFDGKIFGHVQIALSSVLEALYADGINMFLRSKTLSKYLELVYESGLPAAIPNRVNNKNEVDIAIYLLLHHFYQTSASNYTSLESRICNTVFHTIHEKRSNFAKSIYLLYLEDDCKYACIGGRYRISRSNKKLYSQFRRYLFYFLIGTHSDAVSGWLSLAAFFYQHKQYRCTLIITDFLISHRVGPEVPINNDCRIDTLNYVRIYSDVYCNDDCKHFSTRCRHARVSSVAGIAGEGSVFNKSDLCLDIGIPNLILGCSTSVFANYLEFMSFHHMHDYEKRQTALYNIQKAIENAPDDYYYLVNDVLYLNKALQMAKCKFPASMFPKLISNFIKLSAKSSLVEHLEYFCNNDFFASISNRMLDSVFKTLFHS